MDDHVLDGEEVIGVAAGDGDVLVFDESDEQVHSFGRTPKSDEVGRLIRVGNDFLFSGEWWITLFPSLTLVALALGVNVLGDWLRDALNPRLRT